MNGGFDEQMKLISDRTHRNTPNAHVHPFSQINNITTINNNKI